ncbi:hypothetical protein N4T77_16950 [Clostridium sp. CX1]|uniref:hypothetical protein n=1 Tax=Clostridium sp. CX1 TaxID=2978346 RepID=UPI0021C0202A|nr:hypothetical protein [Clostridium sp. CX1]MCT8978278.1 hypothetical protein [Clostridium sp. CX1]
MKKRQVLEQLDSLIDNSRSFIENCDSYSIWHDDIKALEIAKEAVNKEYSYRFLASLICMIAAGIIFGGLTLMAYFIYR